MPLDCYRSHFCFSHFYGPELVQLSQLSLFKQFAGCEYHRIDNARHGESTSYNSAHLKVNTNKTCLKKEAKT